VEIPRGDDVIRFATFDTTQGVVYATASDAGLTGIYFMGGRHAPPIAATWRETPHDAVLGACARQLREYLDGCRTAFDLPLAAVGTPFQQAVWAQIARIPYGATLTYAGIAKALGTPAASRAVGAATGRNPISIVVPCHRVVGTGGSLTGYAGGLERKARLLALERGLAAAA
jgi:methylated-DNA-[protein]-cysteine S-methyltransferase